MQEYAQNDDPDDKGRKEYLEMRMMPHIRECESQIGNAVVQEFREELLCCW